MAARAMRRARSRQLRQVTPGDFDDFGDSQSVGTAKSVGRAPSGGDAAGADLRQMHAELGEEPVSEDAVIWPWAYGLIKYTIFVCIFTYVNVLRRPSIQIYEFAQLWRGLIDGGLEEIVFVDDVWRFLNGEVLSLFDDDFLTASGGYWPNSTKNNYLYGNRQLGAIRLRQLRVLPTDCPYIQQKFFAQDPTTQSLCFGEYDVSSDEGRKGEHFQRSGNALPIVDLPCAEQGCGTAKLVGNKWYNETDRNGTQLDHSVCRPCIGGVSNGENISWFSYQSYKELGESSLSFGGAYGSYPGGGYVIDIHSQPDGRRLLETLQFRHNWLDLKTRALFVDFAFYNPNVDLFLITRCVMEFLPSGVVKGSATHRVLQVTTYDYKDFNTAPLLALEGTLIFFLAWYAGDEAVRIFQSIKRFRYKVVTGLKSYFSTGWNAFEFLVLAGLVGVTYLKVSNIQKTLGVIADMSAIDASALQTLGFWLTQETNMTGFMCLVIWMKIFRYITITQRLTRLFVSMARAIPDTVAYLLVFLIWVIAYSVAAVAIFGTELQEFSTFSDSAVTCLRIVFGDFDVVSIHAANKILGPIWIWSFMGSAVLVLLNFFVAILCEVYAEVMGESDENTALSIVETIKRRSLRILGLKQKVAEITDLEKELDNIDEDGDGMVTKVELQAFLEKEGAFEVFDATEVTEVMRRFDANDNGYLDPHEMAELRDVLRKRKQEIQGQIGREKQAEVRTAERVTRPGAGISHVQQEVLSLNTKFHEISKRLEKNTAVEQKMLATLDTLATKVDSLVRRDEDFKFLKKNIGQDWIK